VVEHERKIGREGRTKEQGIRRGRIEEKKEEERKKKKKKKAGGEGLGFKSEGKLAVK
jgi:hypothetical protein